MNNNNSCKRHHHHHAHNLSGPKLLIVTLLNFLITLVEFAGGIFSNSLSLMSDAVHNLGDTSAVLFAYIAAKISSRKSDLNHTFGYKRVEIITALFNAVILIAICLFLLKEAYVRFVHPESVNGGIMVLVAVVGLIANAVSVILLHNNKKGSMNVRAAYLHLLGDTLSSVAVVAGGVAIRFWHVTWLDPAITVVVSVYIIYHTWGIVRESVGILMQSVPVGIDVPKLKKEIERIPGVEDLHHIHVWALSESQVHFESHIRVGDNMNMEQAMHIRNAVENLLHDNGIIHTTLQIDYGNCSGEICVCDM